MSLRSEVIKVLNEIFTNSKKISELPVATTPVGTELVEIVQGGVNKQTTVADLGGGGGGGGNDKLDAEITFLLKTADYTLQASDKTLLDAGKNLMFVIDSAGPVNLTIPLDATVDIADGAQILVKTIGAGQVTFVPDGIVSITGSSGNLLSPGQNSLMALIKRGTDEWYLENGSAVPTYDLENTEVDTTGGTVILDFNSAFEAQFTSSDDIPSTRDVDISNDTVAIRFVWLFNISTLTPTLLQFPANWIMNDPNFSSNAWTAPSTGDYKMRGEFDGTDWIIDIDVAGTSVADADATTKGIAKLYTALGTNTDGSIDQATAKTNFDLKAPLASPTFTGTPAAPTAAAATNTTQIATTAFVQQEIATAVTDNIDFLTFRNTFNY